MASSDQIPTLLSLMFGQSAGTAYRAASPRLLLWAQAFDDWLAERRRLYSKSCLNKALQAWTRLYLHNQAMPWELRPADLAAHLDWMRAQDFAPNTINGDLSAISLFYRWVAEKRLDPDCEPFFDPAAAVPRLVIKQYEGAVLLSRAEIGSLLDLLQADTSPLGLRERAFTLARLLLGLPFRSLQRLRWGQIQVGENVAVLSWEPESEPVPLPSVVWDAIHAYLVGTGRLPVMEPGSYIFAPLADPTAPGAGLDPGDWASSRFLSSQQIRANLRRYGRLAGIPDHKLESHALRRTAIRLRLDTGDSLEKMQSFLGARSQPRLVDYRLSLLPSLPEDPDSPPPESPADLVLPNRQPHRFQSSDSWIHGLYARSRPAQEIQAVLQEDFQGLEEQIAGLRVLTRGLMERERAAVDRAACDRAASARLIDLFGQATGWLSILIKADEFLSRPGEADDLSR
jgi:site-specific recombinase XerD